MTRHLALFAADGVTVSNIIIGDHTEWPGSDDVTDVVPQPAAGWTRVDGAYAPPAAQPAPEPEPIKIPRDDFIERFGLKWLAVSNAANTDPVLALAFALLMGKPDGMVTLTSKRIPPVMAALVRDGYLTQAEADFIVRLE